MLYLFAVVFPPLAVLLCGKPFQAILNLLLTILGWIPGVIHAMAVVNSAQADARNNKLIRVMQGKSPTMGAGEAVAVGSSKLLKLTIIACSVVGAFALFCLFMFLMI